MRQGNPGILIRPSWTILRKAVPLQKWIIKQKTIKTLMILRHGEFLNQLLKNRMFIGVYIAQYCINAITFFFITWFPVYLVQARGMTILKAGIVAVLPAIFGFVGGNLGGIFSDHLLKRGSSLSVARKVPIVIRDVIIDEYDLLQLYRC